MQRPPKPPKLVGPIGDSDAAARAAEMERAILGQRARASAEGGEAGGDASFSISSWLTTSIDVVHDPATPQSSQGSPSPSFTRSGAASRAASQSSSLQSLYPEATPCSVRVEHAFSPDGSAGAPPVAAFEQLSEWADPNGNFSGRQHDPAGDGMFTEADTDDEGGALGSVALARAAPVGAAPALNRTPLRSRSIGPGTQSYRSTSLGPLGGGGGGGGGGFRARWFPGTTAARGADSGGAAAAADGDDATGDGVVVALAGTLARAQAQLRETKRKLAEVSSSDSDPCCLTAKGFEGKTSTLGERRREGGG